jgi:hypothetical protein
MDCAMRRLTTPSSSPGDNFAKFGQCAGTSFADRLRRRPAVGQWRQMAHGRSLRLDPGRTALPLAPSIRMVLCSASSFRRGAANAAERFLKADFEFFDIRLPRVIVTNKLTSHGVARRQLLPAERREQCGGHHDFDADNK